MKIETIKNDHKKKGGFAGQKAIVIPRKIINEQFCKNPIVGNLYISDIGYYPKARFHYMERLHGAGQHILIYCIEGEGTLKIGKEKFRIEPGNFFIIPLGIAHTYASDESNPWTIYWIHFKGIVSNAITSLIREQLLGFKGYLPFSEERIKVFEYIYGHLERGYSNENIIYANMCLWQYLASFMLPKKVSDSHENLKYNISDLSVDFMRRNIETIITLESIAQSVNLSPSHFSYLFKKETGFPPMEYFNHLKVQKACQYLLFTNLRIKEIACKLGLDDPYYFTRLFTKVMGISPNLYRKKENTIINKSIIKS